VRRGYAAPVSDAPAPHRVVIISPALPYDTVTHAGGRYLQLLERTLEQAGAEVTFLVDGAHPWTAQEPGAPRHALLLGESSRRTVQGRLAARLTREVDQRLRSFDRTWPRLSFAAHLMTSPSAASILREADVVDLQWPETARLVPWVNRLNPDARKICTLHDVMSQRLERQLPGPSRQRRSRQHEVRSARLLERRTLERVDAVIVFSDKDRRLLVAHDSGFDERIEVIAPPLATANQTHRRRPDSRAPIVTFVGLLDRPENSDAAIRLVKEIWPQVVSEFPAARLHIIGQGGPERLRSICRAATNVELLGYVPDLAGAYERASLVVVPLTQGAGVKFKTVEALVAGVPTVTTSVGAEGVGSAKRFAAVEEDPEAIAQAMLLVLREPERAEAAARETQAWASARFSRDSFEQQVRHIYQL
jgi:glycosyltransferase involved in cell wall biosynthesis